MEIDKIRINLPKMINKFMGRGVKTDFNFASDSIFDWKMSVALDPRYHAMITFDDSEPTYSNEFEEWSRANITTYGEHINNIHVSLLMKDASESDLLSTVGKLMECIYVEREIRKQDPVLAESNWDSSDFIKNWIGK